MLQLFAWRKHARAILEPPTKTGPTPACPCQRTTIPTPSLPPHRPVEGPAWRGIDGVWKRIYGNFAEMGVSIEWHEFSNASDVDWARSFHPFSLELCLNFSGRALLHFASTMRYMCLTLYGPQAAASSHSHLLSTVSSSLSTFEPLPLFVDDMADPGKHPVWLLVRQDIPRCVRHRQHVQPRGLRIATSLDGKAATLTGTFKVHDVGKLISWHDLDHG
jgi:hypothetical protein